MLKRIVDAAEDAKSCTGNWTGNEMLESTLDTGGDTGRRREGQWMLEWILNAGHGVACVCGVVSRYFCTHCTGIRCMYVCGLMTQFLLGC